MYRVICYKPTERNFRTDKAYMSFPTEEAAWKHVWACGAGHVIYREKR